MLRNRRGFVRVAVEHGAYLIPVYYFGQSTFLSFGPKWLSELSRKLRMTIGFAYGPLGERGGGGERGAACGVVGEG